MSEPVRLDPLAGLVRKAGRGDRAAGEALVRAVAPRLWRIAWRLLRDAAEAEDVAQETLIRMWKAAPQWQPGRARFETWLHQVATNLCLDRLRKSGRFVEESAAPDPPDPGPAPDAGLMGEALKARVDAALAQLPDRQRAALTLVHYEDMSAAEAGEILGASVEAVESLLSRARRALRDALAPERETLLAAAAAGR